MRLVWVTDPHLNHAAHESRQAWYHRIASHGPDGVVISGDISEGDDVVVHLIRIADQIAVPIYVVLGNHDFYRSSVAATRQNVIAASRDNRHLVYLTDCAPVAVGDGRYLLGDDGWGDATEGDYENSYVQLNDFHLIDDFQQIDSASWKGRLTALGQESARRLEAKLQSLPVDAVDVLVITHVPPFRQACWYQGHTADDHWAPFFVCGQMGNVLRRAAHDRPATRFTTLCGHGHHRGVAQISANLVVHTGAAEYGAPGIEALVEWGRAGIEVHPLAA